MKTLINRVLFISLTFSAVAIAAPQDDQKDIGQLSRAMQTVQRKGKLYLKCIRRNCSEAELKEAQADFSKSIKVAIGALIVVGVGYGIVKYVRGGKKTVKKLIKPEQQPQSSEQTSEIDSKDFDYEKAKSAVIAGTLAPDSWVVDKAKNRVETSLISLALDKNDTNFIQYLIKNKPLSLIQYNKQLSVKKNESYSYDILASALIENKSELASKLVPAYKTLLKNNDIQDMVEWVITSRHEYSPLYLAFAQDGLDNNLRIAVINLYTKYLPQFFQMLQNKYDAIQKMVNAKIKELQQDPAWQTIDRSSLFDALHPESKLDDPTKIALIKFYGDNNIKQFLSTLTRSNQQDFSENLNRLKTLPEWGRITNENVNK